jgi:integral membrane protein
MIDLFRTSLGRLRVLSFLEGLSLLFLLFIAVPTKYFGDDPALVKLIGPIHGALFLLFILNTLSVAVAYKWEFNKTTWKVLIACIIPFGTFYIDKYILLPAARRDQQKSDQ